MDAQMEALFAQMVRLHPPTAVLQQVEAAPPLSLTDGERRLRQALTARDWPLAMRLARRLAMTEGFSARLEASARKEDSLWGTLGQVILARLRRLKDVEAQIDALETQITQAPSREGRLPLVQEQIALRIAHEFQGWLQQRFEADIAAGAGPDLVLRALAMIAREAYLDNEETWEWGLEIGQTIAVALRPEDVSMADTN
jgi:hypothetical protein